MYRLQEKYQAEVRDQLMKEFSLRNVMQVPRVEKIVVNVGVGSETQDNSKALDAAVGDLTIITGQKPVVAKARKSISNFKLREGKPIGVKVTLRGQRMWAFLDRLVNVALPRVRDFRGVPSESFDGRGNYTLGLREQLVFPEIEYDKIDKVRGLEITVVTTAADDEQGRRLLQLLGMPFVKKGA
jgi:large subunit ribosomal protein L5